MDCKHFEEDISAYVDGELDAGQTRQLEEHFASCESCRRLHDEIVSLKEAVGALPEPHVAPEELWNLSSVAPARKPGRTLAILSRVAAVAFVAVTAFAFGVVFSSLQQRSAEYLSAPAVRSDEPQARGPIVGAPGPEKGAPSDGISGGEPSEPKGSSIATDYAAPADDELAGPAAITVVPYTGTKPHGAAYAYKITANEVAVMVAIDRHGRILVVRPLKR